MYVNEITITYEYIISLNFITIIISKYKLTQKLLGLHKINVIIVKQTLILINISRYFINKANTKIF